jgi:branched-chain amino acid transport system substrate-binding protein
VASDLILNEGVHLLMPASTTDTINPAADQAELNGVPCLSTGAPWQAIVFPRGGRSLRDRADRRRRPAQAG